MARKFLIMLLATAVVAGNAYALDMKRAKSNYDRYCAACHGFNGMSVMPDTPHLRMNEGLLQTDLQILDKLKRGSSRKPPMSGILSEQDLLEVISYSRTLR